MTLGGSGRVLLVVCDTFWFLVVIFDLLWFFVILGDPWCFYGSLLFFGSFRFLVVLGCFRGCWWLLVFVGGCLWLLVICGGSW